MRQEVRQQQVAEAGKEDRGDEQRAPPRATAHLLGRPAPQPTPTVEKPTDVVIRMDAAPINPSDIGVVGQIHTGLSAAAAPLPPRSLVIPPPPP